MSEVLNCVETSAGRAVDFARFASYVETACRSDRAGPTSRACARFVETAFACRRVSLSGTSAREARRPSRSSVKASEGWLGRRDSNPNNRVQSAVSYR